MGPRWWAAVLRRALASGERRRWRSWLFILALFFCSPVLLPLACLSFPLLCVAGLCLRAGRQWRRGSAASMTILLPREEIEPRLLQRYLEDQLRLVAGGLIIESEHRRTSR
ncbi:hypothetical protein ZIOFF_010984 [Zingiber officinale]|nr:hypothetical protein ZIOFF_010984 [Zingiber officinale]